MHLFAVAAVPHLARRLLFAFMLRNAVRAVDLFRIPTDNFIEMGRLVEI